MKSPRLIALFLFLLGFLAYWWLAPEPVRLPRLAEQGTMFFAGKNAETTRTFDTTAGSYDLQVTSRQPWQVTVRDESGLPVVTASASDTHAQILDLPTGTHRLQVLTKGDWTVTLRRHRVTPTPLPPATLRSTQPSRR